MVGQQFLRFQNQVVQQVRSFLCFGHFCLHQTVTERRARHIMRRRTTQVLVSAFNDQQMAVLHSRIKMYAPVT